MTRSPRAVLLPVLGVVTLALCGLLLLGLGTARFGGLALLVGAAAALVPVCLVVATFLWVDRWEPEPARILLLAFFWGACAATVTALVLNGTAGAVGTLVLGQDNGHLVRAVFSAPVVEEAAKGVFVLGVLLWRRDEFDGVVDGIVYAGMTAAGFAFTENIYYFGTAFIAGGIGDATSGVLGVFILRGVLAPFTHPLFTAMTGIGIGIAARTAAPKLRILAPVLGYLGAVLLHALWNGSASFGTADAFLNVYFLVMAPLFFAIWLLIVFQRKREQRVIAAQLPAMKHAGWIAGSEIRLLGSLVGRRRWRAEVRRRSGRLAARAVTTYQIAVTELAFLRHAMDRGTAGIGAEDRHQLLLVDLLLARSAALRYAES
jgi:RsiW-degrading membrane proteinase PrsW (M82 family)